MEWWQWIGGWAVLSLILSPVIGRWLAHVSRDYPKGGE